MTLIEKTDDLQEFCQRQQPSTYLTIDTEFMREKTYWPKLCLIQVAGPDEAAAIDPLAPGIDLTPLFELIGKPNIVKVFHAARQDLEIFFHLLGHIPEPLFDTQIAAMVCGFGDQASYESLVTKLTRAKLDKGSRFTDWAARPLSARQLTYALSDVTHLRTVYAKLCDKLEASGRAGWLADDMAALADPTSYRIEPMEAYKRIKSRGAKPRVLAILREVAAWRERTAQTKDLPRAWISKDDTLLEIAHHAPKTADQLARTRGFSRRQAEDNMGREILDAVASAMALPDEDLPPVAAKRDLPRGIGPVADLLKVLLKMVCERENVAQKLVASSDEIELLAAFGEDSGIAALKGWRRTVYGEEALKVRRGQLAIAVRGRSLTLIPHPE
jgi:ribonuclease D